MAYSRTKYLRDNYRRGVGGTGYLRDSYRRGVGADDPWANTAGAAEPGFFDKIGSSLSSLFTPTPVASSLPAQPIVVLPAAPKPVVKPAAAPSTISNVGSGIAAFLNTLGKPAVAPAVTGTVFVQPQGMSTTTKLVIAGGAFAVLALVISRR